MTGARRGDKNRVYGGVRPGIPPTRQRCHLGPLFYPGERAEIFLGSGAIKLLATNTQKFIMGVMNHGAPALTWKSFRILLSDLLRFVGMPRAAVFAAELSYEGDRFIPELWSTWSCILDHLQDGESWEDVAFTYVHDLVLDLGGTPIQAKRVADIALECA